MFFELGKKYIYKNNNGDADLSRVGQVAVCEGINRTTFRPTMVFPDGEVISWISPENFEPFKEASSEIDNMAAQIKWHRQMAGALQQVQNLLKNQPK